MSILFGRRNIYSKPRNVIKNIISLNNRRKKNILPIFSSANCVRYSTLSLFNPQRTRNLSIQFKRPFSTSTSTVDIEELKNLATEYAKLIYKTSIKVDNDAHILILYDNDHELTRILTHAYASSHDPSKTQTLCVPENDQVYIIEKINSLKEGDVVVVVQSTAFRLNEYRLRIELFKRGLKTIEHHYLKMHPPEQYKNYINSLAFVPDENVKNLAIGLKNRIDNANKIVVKCFGDVECVYEGGMEPTLLNIGDYEGMKNCGGNFPVGEVFSEPKDLTKVNGEMMVWGYPDKDFYVRILEKPFKITIKNGHVVDFDSSAPKDFLEVIEDAKNEDGATDEGIMIREFGLGLNPYLSKDRHLYNITAFERQKGMHISLGRKHTVYKKPGVSAKRSRYHIDLFIDVEEIDVDGFKMYKNGEFYY